MTFDEFMKQKQDASQNEAPLEKDELSDEWAIVMKMQTAIEKKAKREIREAEVKNMRRNEGVLAAQIAERKRRKELEEQQKREDLASMQKELAQCAMQSDSEHR